MSYRNGRTYESCFAGYLRPDDDSKMQHLLSEVQRLTKENLILKTENAILKKLLNNEPV
jgi:hypothetical protein